MYTNKINNTLFSLSKDVNKFFKKNNFSAFFSKKDLKNSLKKQKIAYFKNNTQINFPYQLSFSLNEKYSLSFLIKPNNFQPENSYAIMALSFNSIPDINFEKDIYRVHKFTKEISYQSVIQFINSLKDEKFFNKQNLNDHFLNYFFSHSNDEELKNKDDFEKTLQSLDLSNSDSKMVELFSSYRMKNGFLTRLPEFFIFELRSIRKQMDEGKKIHEVSIKGDPLYQDVLDIDFEILELENKISSLKKQRNQIIDVIVNKDENKNHLTLKGSYNTVGKTYSDLLDIMNSVNILLKNKNYNFNSKSWQKLLNKIHSEDISHGLSLANMSLDEFMQNWLE